MGHEKKKQINSPLLPKDPLSNYLLQREKKQGKDKLSRQQINQCLMDIEDAHPLQREACIDDIWPCLRYTCCQKRRKPDFRKTMRMCFHKKLGIEVTKSGDATSAQEERELTDRGRKNK